MPRGRSLTEEQTEERREHIMDAAIRCFADKGYHRTAVSDIAREAGLAQGTLYLYFSSKKDLLFQFLERAVAEPAAATFREADSASPQKTLGAFIEARLKLPARNRNVLKVVFAEAFSDREIAEELSHKVLLPTARALAGYLKRCDAEGTLQVGNPELAAQTLTAMVAGHVLIWGEVAGSHAGRFTARARAEFLLNFFLEATSPQTPKRQVGKRK